VLIAKVVLPGWIQQMR